MMRRDCRVILIDKKAFTLLELLVSIAMSAAILLVVNTLLYASIRLREKAEEKVQVKSPIQRVVTMMQRDLANAVALDTALEDSFIGESEGNHDSRQDRVEFFTSTGRLLEDEPFGEIQKVDYFIVETADFDRQNKLSLVRSVTRNIFSSIEVEPEYTIMLRGVRSLELTYYDGENWLDSWDSTEQDVPLPVAVRIRILYAPHQSENNTEQLQLNQLKEFDVYLIEMIVPINVTPLENSGSELSELDEVESSEENPEDGGQGDLNQQPGGARS